MANERYILIRPPQLPELAEVGAGAYVVGYDTATDRTVKINVSALGGGAEADINWKSNIAYTEGQIVEYGLKLWKSLVDENEGNFPNEGANWTEVSKAGSGSNITNYTTGVYTSTPSLVLKDGQLFRLSAATPFESVNFEAERATFKWQLVNDNNLIGIAYGAGMTGAYKFVNADDTLVVLSAGSIDSISPGTADLTITLTEPSFIVKTGIGNTLADFTILPLYKEGANNLVYIFDAETAGNDIGLQIPVGGVILFYHNAGGFRWVDDEGMTLHTIAITEPSIISRTGAGVTLGDLTIAPIGGGGGHSILDENGDVVAQADALQFRNGHTVTSEAGKTVVDVDEAIVSHVDGADEAKHSSNQITEAAAHTLIATAANAKVSVVLQAIVNYLGTVLSVDGIDLSSIEVGESVLPRVTKQSDGSGVIDTASELLDKHVASTISELLIESANWGNISGKSSDWIRLFGNNSNGELGDVGQEYVNDEGVFFECRGSILAVSGSGGYADWVRNRNRDVLKSSIAVENAIINAVLAATFNSEGRAAVTSIRCKLGDWFAVHPAGYRYSCYREEDTNSNGQADLWWWYRDSLPVSDVMQIFSTGNYVNLVSALNAHDFTTSSYDPSALVSPNERGTQGQQYYNPSTRKLFKCLWDGSKIVWEQINLVK